MSFDPATILTRSSETIATEVDGEIVLISIEDGKYYGMDLVGSEIWRRLDNPKRVDALVAELTAHFDGDPAAIEADTYSFLTRLSDNGLLRAG